MPNLADSHMREQFVRKLEACEAPLALRHASDWERRFISDLREHFEGREDAIDLGCVPWNPTSNQWNTLSEIAGKLK